MVEHPHIHGIVPPMTTPFGPDDTIDEDPVSGARTAGDDDVAIADAGVTRAADEFAQRVDGNVRAPAREHADATVVARLRAHLFRARHESDVLAAQRVLVRAGEAAEESVECVRVHDALRAASSAPMRAGAATQSAPARSIARDGMLPTTHVAGSWT